MRIGIRIRERIDSLFYEDWPGSAYYAGHDWDATELLAVGRCQWSVVGGQWLAIAGLRKWVNAEFKGFSVSSVPPW
jgi:hypothetical protein